ncbi:unnamed protein product [Dibothriocephalus latus]|uniref:Uncharacterized protein n=1 Tax=Dibothriocephalus latus TaxID=60516 RepID=A0A3P7R0Q8_DIBLA|nr:unnamed protein product [Dibothriocephalus latus]
MEQLLKIVEVFGLPPCRMLEASPKLENFFERVTPGDSALAGGQSESPASSSSSVFAKAVITVRGIVYRPRRYWTKGGATTKVGAQSPHYPLVAFSFLHPNCTHGSVFSSSSSS